MIDSKIHIQNLVILVQNGNKDAFGELYQLFAPLIYRFALFKVNNINEAQDLTQKIFLKVYQDLRKNKGKYKNFRAFIYQVARNTIIDYYRTFKLTVSWEDQKEQNHMVKDVDDWLEQKEQAKEIIHLLNKLSDIEKEVVVLTCIEEMKLDEAAKILKKSNLAIRLIKWRALKKLRKLAIPCHSERSEESQ